MYTLLTYFPNSNLSSSFFTLGKYQEDVIWKLYFSFKRQDEVPKFPPKTVCPNSVLLFVVGRQFGFPINYLAC